MDEKDERTANVGDAVVVDNADGFGFSAALIHIKDGGRCARRGWNGQGQFVFLVPGSQFEVNREPLASILGVGTPVTYRPHIDLKATDGTVGVWAPQMSDIMAEDWYVVDPD